MRIFNFVIVTIFVIALFSSAASFTNSPQTKLPVYIKYLNQHVPDSIQDFMKVYFQVKKVEVINFDGYMSLFKEQLSEKMNDWVTSGKADGMNDSKLAKYKAEILIPICNVLAMDLFYDSTSTDKYFIDSIHWFVDVLPVKDTSKRKTTTYIPGTEIKDNPYSVLKTFTEIVLQSKLLK